MQPAKDSYAYDCGFVEHKAKKCSLILMGYPFLARLDKVGVGGGVSKMLKFLR